MLFVIELLGKIIYLCNRLLLKKLLLEILEKRLHLLILKAFNFARCIKDLRY